jgi:hypothetical protein
LGDKLEDGVMAHILIGLDLNADYSDDLVSGVQGGGMPSGGTPSSAMSEGMPMGTPPTMA